MIDAPLLDFAPSRRRTELRKYSTWLMAARTSSTLNGFEIKNVGSGRKPVSSRSGYAVINITGSSPASRI